MMLTLRHGDCVEVMGSIPEGSVGAVVCDPPYGIRFMNKEFDDLGDGTDQHAWLAAWLRECFRVLVPGGRILAFGGSRVYHRMAAAFDDAGFIDVGLEAWSYGSGFPKSMSLSEVGWSGWGTQLKPAWEPFIVGTKPG